jgi:hypothetical protein
MTRHFHRLVVTHKGMKHSKIYIAGTKTSDDWKQVRPLLASQKDHAAWEKAYTDFYLTRLNMRYLKPIKLLQDGGAFEGEGFSIVTIQCSLVEFLETTIQGTSYRYLRNGETLGQHEYSSSKDVFISFLTNREPFRQHFDPLTAKAFYEHIRCGLLHEARTKAGWKIWARTEGTKIIDVNAKTVFRDNLQVAFETFLVKYKDDLMKSEGLQAAFVRKFDSLCRD